MSHLRFQMSIGVIPTHIPPPQTQPKPPQKTKPILKTNKTPND